MKNSDLKQHNINQAKFMMQTYNPISDEMWKSYTLNQTENKDRSRIVFTGGVHDHMQTWISKNLNIFRAQLK